VKSLALSHLMPSGDPAYDEYHWEDATAGSWKSALYVGKTRLKIEL